MDLKDQHRHHDHPHLHLSHPYLHSQVDQVGSGKDFKDAESSKLQERQETCLPPELCLWFWVPGPLFMILIGNDVCCLWLFCLGCGNICVSSGSPRCLLSHHSSCNQTHPYLLIKALEILEVNFSQLLFRILTIIGVVQGGTD